MTVGKPASNKVKNTTVPVVPTTKTRLFCKSSPLLVTVSKTVTRNIALACNEEHEVGWWRSARAPVQVRVADFRRAELLIDAVIMFATH